MEGAQRDLSGGSSEVIMREPATQISEKIEGRTVVVRTISDQIGEVTQRRPDKFSAELAVSLEQFMRDQPRRRRP